MSTRRRRAAIRGVIRVLVRVSDDAATVSARASGRGLAPARWFTPIEWGRLAGIYGVVIALHAIGWGLFVHYSQRYTAMVGMGLTAYLFGLRHAFDADHIAAVDDTIRYMLQKGKRPLGVGLFFSLGHSTIVFGLAVAIAFTAAAIKRDMPTFQVYGGVIGASVSGVFLWFVGILNLLVLLDLARAWGNAHSHDHTHIDELLAKRGFMNRIFGNHARKFINHSWQIYPVGVLFGLGFDTASEVGLLALAAGASVGNMPIAAVLSLPVLFAAGMSGMDATDGVLMAKAYHWAFVNPARKLLYNLTTTSLGVLVALVIGTLELAGVLVTLLGLHGGVFDVIHDLDLGQLGYVVVALFLLAWSGSYAWWRWHGGSAALGSHVDVHTHADGVTHFHRRYR